MKKKTKSKVNVRQLKSGRWQSIVYLGTIDGKKKYATITEDTKQECIDRALSVYLERKERRNIPDQKITVSEAVDNYIDSKRGTLSPASIAGYVNSKKRYIAEKPIALCKISDLTSQHLQTWVSSLGGKVSKKTIKNAYGLLCSSVKQIRPEVAFAVTFPKEKPFKSHVPSWEDVKLLLETAKNTKPDLYRACLLAAFGTMRRGEISCLTSDDITGNTIFIDKDMVQDERGKWVIKNTPKEEASVRPVDLPPWIIAEMPEGRLVKYTPQGITREFNATLKKLDIPHFRFHDLRKYSVSMLHHYGVSMATIQKIGGWSNMDTPQRIYISTVKEEEEREKKNYLAAAERMKI